MVATVAQETVTGESPIDKGNTADGDGRDGDDDEMQLFSSLNTRPSRPDNLGSGQSGTLYGLSARGMGVLTPEAVSEETRRSKSGPALALGTHLENPTQERLEWLTKAVLASRGMDTVGWKTHAGAVREASPTRRAIPRTASARNASEREAVSDPNPATRAALPSAHLRHPRLPVFGFG